jgi:hypothetical protein
VSRPPAKARSTSTSASIARPAIPQARRGPIATFGDGAQRQIEDQLGRAVRRLRGDASHSVRSRSRCCRNGVSGASSPASTRRTVTRLARPGAAARAACGCGAAWPAIIREQHRLLSQRQGVEAGAAARVRSRGLCPSHRWARVGPPSCNTPRRPG